MNKKIDKVQVATIGAVLLSLAGTLLSGWTSQKKMEDEIDKAVNKHFESEDK